jgi:hypothetical protein
VLCACLQVCDTIVTTVPKSVVHCLVRKAEKNLLNHMFGHVHKMSEVEIERMLQVSTSAHLQRSPWGCGVLWRPQGSCWHSGLLGQAAPAPP